MTTKWSDDYCQLVAQANPDLNTEEFARFRHVCESVELDPLRNQIYAKVRRWKDKGGEWRRSLSIETGIDGFRLIARRDGLAGIDDAFFMEGQKHPEAATVTVYRWGQGGKEAYTATARWDEYYPGQRQGQMWHKMPHTMLAKCAEALALRKGFQALSGIYTSDEMGQADKEESPSPSPSPSDDKLQGLRDAVRSRWRQLKASTPSLTWTAVCEAASVPTKGHTAYQLRRLNDHLKDELENAPETAEGDAA